MTTDKKTSSHRVKGKTTTRDANECIKVDGMGFITVEIKRNTPLHIERLPITEITAFL